MDLPSIKKKNRVKSIVSATQSVIDESQQFQGLEWLQMDVVWVKLIRWEQDQWSSLVNMVSLVGHLSYCLGSSHPVQFIYIHMACSGEPCLTVISSDGRYL